MLSFLIVTFITIAIITVRITAGVAIDDVHAIRRRRAYDTHPHARRYRWRPTVTVLLATTDNHEATKATLESLTKNTYRQLEIIIVGTKRRRRTLKQLAGKFARRTRPIYVFTGAGDDHDAYHRYGHGNITVNLRAGDELENRAVKRAVWHLTTQPDTWAIQANRTVSAHNSTSSLLQTYFDAVTYFWKKQANVFNSARIVPTTSDIFFSRAEGPTHHLAKVYFADDVIARRPATLRFSSLKASYLQLTQSRATTWRQWPFAICLGYTLIALPWLLSYAIFLALAAHQPQLLFACIALIGVAILTGVWSQPHLSQRQKISLSLLLPMSLIPFFLLVFVFATIPLVVLTRSLRRYEPQPRSARGYGRS